MYDIHLQESVGHINYFIDRGHAKPKHSRECDDAKFLESLLSDKQLGILPPGMIWISEARTAFVMQREPEYQLVAIRDGLTPECSCWPENDEGMSNGTCDVCTGHVDTVEDHHGMSEGWYRYRLPMPWTVYWIGYHRGSFFLDKILTSPSPVESFTQELGSLPLPNMYNGGGMCAGDMGISSHLKYAGSAQAAFNEIINSFWSSAFNKDVSQYLEFPVWMALEQQAGDCNYIEDNIFKYWEGLSFEELLQLPWGEGISLQYLINRKKNFEVGMTSESMTRDLNRCVLLSSK